MFDVVGDGLLIADSASPPPLSSGTPRSGPSCCPPWVSTARQTARLLVPFLDYATASPGGVETEDVFMRYALDVSYGSGAPRARCGRGTPA
jgi:hypothetical protein